MPSVLAWFQAVFNFMPGIAGYCFAMAGVALLFMADDLKRLDKFRKTRLVIAGIVFLVGLGAVISDNAAKIKDRQEADSDRHSLNSQVTELLTQQAILQAQVRAFNDQNLPKLIGGISKSVPVPPRPLPDLHLRLVYPTHDVAIEVYNDLKGGVADRPKYQITLADLDNLEGDLLKIPAQEGDFIRPGESWGPTLALGLPAVKAVVKDGDHIFGYALVLCPDCVKTRSYWVYIEQGRSGWYTEMDTPLFPSNMKFFENLKNHIEWLNQIAPPEKRIPIEDPK
jgi:hypothetical protein